MQRQKDKQKRSTEASKVVVSIELEAGGSLLRYSLLRHRGVGAGGGPGWIEEAIDGDSAGEVRRVSACETFAMARLVGREDEVTGATEALATSLRSTGGRHAHEQSARLRVELGRGQAGERVPVEALQQATLRAIGRGISLATLAEHAGLRRPSGEGDVTGYLRRVGLSPSTAGARARTAPYEEAVRLAAALDLDPVDAGV